jgi:hypothetical protein
VHNKFKKIQKNTKPSRCVMLCDLVSRKNNKLRILETFWKSVHKKELPYTKFHGFQARWASSGDNHGIVCSNNPILCTCVHLGMSNKVALGSINFLCTKNSFFIFLMLKMGSFVKRLPKICFKNVPTHFYKILYHILCTIHKLFALKRIYSHPSRNWQIYANSAGSGPNLNYRYFIVCSCFFPKIIFRYASTYFIIDPYRFLQDSIPT